jgi:hypothetical protein
MATEAKAFILAARELRRVHQIHCSHYKAAWSHGDLHLENIICDVDSERAALIDFDTRHEFRIEPRLVRYGGSNENSVLVMSIVSPQATFRPTASTS